MAMVNILKKTTTKNFFCTKIGYFYCKFGAKHKILQDDRVLKVKKGDNSE